MKASSSFFQNLACEHFPCHEGVDHDDFNCLFCYCPLYALGDKCGGSFCYTESGVKVCTGCTLLHVRDEGAEIVKRRFPELKELAHANRTGAPKGREDVQARQSDGKGIIPKPSVGFCERDSRHGRVPE